MKIWAQSSGVEVARKWWEKKHPCWTNLCASRTDWAQILCICWDTPSENTGLLQRESFPRCFILSTVLQSLLAKSVFKLMLILSNYQTCTFPLTYKLADSPTYFISEYFIDTICHLVGHHVNPVYQVTGYRANCVSYTSNACFERVDNVVHL